MVDGISFYPDNPVSSNELVFKKLPAEPAKESAKDGATLYKSDKFDVFVPKKPNIPLNEGLHIEISDGHDSADSPKEVLARYTLALGSAKVLAESAVTQDAWANTRVEKGQTVSVYGRVPGVEKSWRKPVDAFNREVPEIANLEPNYDTQELQKLYRRYLPKWEQLINKVSLFKKGVNEKDIEGRNNYIVWESDKFIVDVVGEPHIRGYHLVVNPKTSFKRQWQTVKPGINPNPVIDEKGKVNAYIEKEQAYVQATLEATAVAMGIQKLLAEGRGEIHNSGNWDPYLRTKDDGGRLDLKNFQMHRKMEKQSHRPDIAKPDKQFGTSMHVHVFIPEKDGSFQPIEMFKQEAIERGRADVVKQWDETPPTTPVQLEEIKAKLGSGQLTKWIEENCQGKLISKAT